MEPKVYRPHGALATFVDYFWTFEWTHGEAGRTLKMFATGVSGILLQHTTGVRRMAAAAAAARAAAGVRRPFFMESEPGRVRPSPTGRSD
jgi:hypothetical protein